LDGLSQENFALKTHQLANNVECKNLFIFNQNMLTQNNNSFREMHTSKLKSLGLIIISVSALISSFTGNWYYLLFGIIGLFLFGCDTQKRGRLKQFIWMNVIYLLIFAILIYLQLSGIPWG
jgi:hypothetical protein